jgi:hypothetical protein
VGVEDDDAVVIDTAIQRATAAAADGIEPAVADVVA